LRIGEGLFSAGSENFGRQSRKQIVMIPRKPFFIPLLLGILTLQALPVRAEPVKGEAETQEMSEQDIRIASLFVRIHDCAVQEEKIKEAAVNRELTPNEKALLTNLQMSVQKLGELVDVPHLKAELSEDLEELKENLGPRHPQRRQVELLLNSLEKYGEAKE
jgi:hypothetical protein